ncbi:MULTISPECIES: SWIM zinc finger family protein [Gordonia]
MSAKSCTCGNWSAEHLPCP